MEWLDNCADFRSQLTNFDVLYGCPKVSKVMHSMLRLSHPNDLNQMNQLNKKSFYVQCAMQTPIFWLTDTCLT